MRVSRVDLLVLVVTLMLHGVLAPLPALEVSDVEVEEALVAAGDNRSELERVLDHFGTGDDAQKHVAARFLIANMPGHSYATISLVDQEGERLEFDALAYENFVAARKALEEIEAERGELEFKRERIDHDLETVSADYLIENIDLAFTAWRGNPWSRGLDFAAFCEHVLPYRGSNEPVESWRGACMEKLAGVVDTLEDPEDPRAAASAVGKIAGGWVRFDEIFYLHPTDQGYEEMSKRRQGRCEDITNMTTYAMRAAAIASAADYTPHWANHGNNHAWSVILDQDGRGSAGLFHRAAKVYRKTYSLQRENLAFQKLEDEKVPAWLGGKNYMDVTTSYMETTDVTVELTRPTPEGTRFAYICVWNDGEWRPIHWGRIEDDSVVFTAMGRQIAYLPAYFTDEAVVAAADAFVLDDQGIMRSVVADAVEVESITLPVKGIGRGKTYELLVWRDGWEEVTTVTIPDGEESLTVSLPAGAFLWPREKDGREEERIFTFAGGVPTRW